MSSFKTLRGHLVFIKIISVWDLFCQPLSLPTCLCPLPSAAPPSWWPGPWSGQAGGPQLYQQTPLTLSRSRPGWWPHHSASAGLMGVIIIGDLYCKFCSIYLLWCWRKKMKHHEKWGLSNSQIRWYDWCQMMSSLHLHLHLSIYLPETSRCNSVIVIDCLLAKIHLYVLLQYFCVLTLDFWLTNVNIPSTMYPTLPTAVQRASFWNTGKITQRFLVSQIFYCSGRRVLNVKHFLHDDRRNYPEIYCGHGQSQPKQVRPGNNTNFSQKLFA